MIHSKEDYKEYLQADKHALGITRKRPKFLRMKFGNLSELCENMNTITI